MIKKLQAGTLVFVSLVIIGLATAFLPGCANPAIKTAPAAVANLPEQPASTALKSLPVAKSALATTAPDARLYTVQTAKPVTATSTPEWQFVFVSPSTGKAYAVYVAHGKSSPPQEAPSSGLRSGESSALPKTTDAWKIDSDTAYAKALGAIGAKAPEGTAYLGMETYRATDDTSTVKPFVWRVHLYPATSNATTRTLDVNATTGAVTVIK